MKAFWVTYEDCVCAIAKNEKDAKKKVLKWNEDYFIGASDEIKIVKVEKE